MKNKSKIFLVSIVIFISSFWLSGKVQAGSCGDITGQSCVANDCGSTMDPATPTSAFTCDAGFVCCKPKPVAVTATSGCTSLPDGASCTTSNGSAGTCSGGTCATGASSTPTSPTGSAGTYATAAPTASAGATAGWNSANLAQFGLPWTDILTILLGILDWLLSIIGIIAVIAFVISGIQYFLVASDEKMMERAKGTMTAAIIGIIVALSGLVIIYAVDTMLNARGLF